MDYNIGLESLLLKAGLGLKKLFIPYQGNNWSPKFLESRTLFYAVVFVLVIKIVSVGISLPLPANWFFADITKVDLLNLLNQNRQNIGTQPLTESAKLDQAAMLKAQDMVAKGYFAHQSPQGLTPWYWFRQVGYNYKYAGENLAVGFIDSKEVFNAWLNSPSHKANLDNPNYKEVGTAILSGFQGNSTIVVQVFGSTQPAAVKPITPAATAAPKPSAPAPILTPAPKPAPEPTPKPVPVQTPVPEPVPTQTSPSQSTIAENPALQQVLGGETQIAQPQSEKIITNNAYGSFVNFLIYDYQKMVTYLVLLFLILVSFSSLLNIMVNFNVQRGRLVATSMAMVIILFGALILNPAFISQIIPHQLII